MPHKLSKKTRLERLAALIRRHECRNQQELIERLGSGVTQSSVSRDLADLGVVKVDGIYQMPQIAPGRSQVVDFLTCERVGDHLLVLKTGPGHAQVAALHIDREKLANVAGTIAGEDTIFVAVRNAEDQIRIQRRILALFAQPIDDDQRAPSAP